VVLTAVLDALGIIQLPVLDATGELEDSVKDLRFPSAANTGAPQACGHRCQYLHPEPA